MGRRNPEEARRLAEEFVTNAESGRDDANDTLVRDLDPRDPYILDSEPS